MLGPVHQQHRLDDPRFTTGVLHAKKLNSSGGSKLSDFRRLRSKPLGFYWGLEVQGSKLLGFHISGLGKFKDRSHRLSDIRVWRIGVGGQGSFSS